MKRNRIIFFSIVSVAALGFFAQEGESHRSGSKGQDVAWWKFDEYSNIPFGKEKLRLNEFISRLRADPTLTAYILAYAGQQACAGEAQRRAKRAKNYIQHSGGIRPARVKILDAGYQKVWQIDLYVAPPDAQSHMSEVIASTDGHLPTVDVRVVKCRGKFFW